MKIVNSLMKLFTVVMLSMASIAFAQVATVFELTGTATAIPATAAGTPVAAGRTLRKGDGLYQGETITTGDNSGLVIAFLDAQVVALAANSRFAISAYEYNRNDASKSNVLLSLLDGGMRAITGLIGKARPQQVSYRVGNATIGIRGTTVDTAIRGSTVAVVVVDGALVLTVNGRTITIGKGLGITTNGMGALVSKPAAEVIADIKASQSNAIALVWAAMANTARPGVLEAAINKALSEATNTNRSTGGTSGTSGTSGSNSGSGSSGGGSTRPACSTISPASARNPGVNCTL
jgi:hypothetical protein